MTLAAGEWRPQKGPGSGMEPRRDLQWLGMTRSARGWAAAKVGLGLMLMLVPAWAQQAAVDVPDAPSSAIEKGGALQLAANQAPTNQTPIQEAQPSGPRAAGASHAPAHAFWDRTNVLLFSGVAVFR